MTTKRIMPDSEGNSIHMGFYHVPKGIVDGEGVCFVYYDGHQYKKSWMLEHYNEGNQRKPIFLFPATASVLRRYDDYFEALEELSMLNNPNTEQAEQQRQFIRGKVKEFGLERLSR